MSESSSNRPVIVQQRSPRSNLESGPVLSVRYWKRMNLNKVYPILVSTTGGVGAAPVTLRLVVAGAQVVPVEQMMDAANARAKLTFYVTPLAKGPLRCETLEVLHQGKKIQELHLPSKVCTARAPLIWLLATLFIPWLMLHYLVYAPVGFRPPLNPDGSEAYVRRPAEKYAQGEDKPEPRAAKITHFVEDNTPGLKMLLGDKKSEVNEDTKEKAKQDKKDAAKEEDHAPSYLESAYLQLVRGYRELDQPLAFYIFLLLLVCTFVSFIRSHESRGTVRGRPLTPAAFE